MSDEYDIAKRATPGSAEEQQDIISKDGFVKIDALASKKDRFAFWALRTGAHPPTLIATEELMVMEHTEEGPKVRMVIVLDDERGITIHPSGNFEVRTPWLSEDENRKYL